MRVLQRGGRWVLGLALLVGGSGVGCGSCPVNPETPPLAMLTTITDQAIVAFVGDVEAGFSAQGTSLRDTQPLVIITGTRAGGDVPLGATKTNLDLAIADQFRDAGFQVLSPDLVDQILRRSNMRAEDLALGDEFQKFKGALRGAQYEADYYFICNSTLTGVADRKDGTIQKTTVQVSIRLSDPDSLKTISQDQGGAVLQDCGGDWYYEGGTQ